MSNDTEGTYISRKLFTLNEGIIIIAGKLLRPLMFPAYALIPIILI